MSFIYITGAPGSGKSTILHELQKRGLEAYDLDDAKFGGAHNKISGEKVAIPPASERSANWFDEHEWRIYRSAFEELKSKSQEKNIVVCGVAEQDSRILDLFDKVIYLFLDDNILIERLKLRTDNDYGKNSDELKKILGRKQKLDTKYLNPATHKIDASKTLDEVVDELFTLI